MKDYPVLFWFILLLPFSAYTQDSLPCARIEKYIPYGRIHYLNLPVDKVKCSQFSNFTLQEYIETDHVWVSVSTGTDSLLTASLKSYAVSAIYPDPDSCLLSFSGKLNTGNTEVFLTRSWNPNGNPPDYDGWNLIGNPYPSASDWESTAWSLQNVDPVLYFFDGINYRPYNRNNHLGNGSRFIPSNQGFFLHVTSGNSGVVSTDNSSRVHNINPFYKSSGFIIDLLRIEAQGNNFTDEAFIHFDPTTTLQFDPDDDAYKLFGIPESPQVFSILPDKLAAINVRPYSGYNTLVPLGFKSGTEGAYSLVFHGLNTFFEIDTIYLEDKKLDEWQNLSADSIYNFTSNPDDDPGRFVIHFNYTVTGVRTQVVNTCFFIYGFEHSVTVMKQCQEFQSEILSIFDMTGRRIYQTTLTGGGSRKIFLNVNNGYYLVLLNSDTGICKKMVYLY